MAATPASDNSFATTDYEKSHYGSTEFATRIAGTSWSTSAYNDFALNSSGLTHLADEIEDNGGIARLGARFSGDIDNSAPTYPGGSGEKDFFVGAYFADQTALAPPTTRNWSSSIQVGTALLPPQPRFRPRAKPIRPMLPTASPNFLQYTTTRTSTIPRHTTASRCRPRPRSVPCTGTPGRPPWPPPLRETESGTLIRRSSLGSRDDVLLANRVL